MKPFRLLFILSIITFFGCSLSRKAKMRLRKTELMLKLKSKGIDIKDLKPIVKYKKGKSGLIKGKIIDKKTKIPIIGSAIMVEGTSLGSFSNMNGNYEIKNIPIGEYKLINRYSFRHAIQMFSDMFRISDEGNTGIVLEKIEEQKQKIMDFGKKVKEDMKKGFKNIFSLDPSDKKKQE